MKNPTHQFGNVTTVLGTQWGDEGKGKLIDAFCEHFDIVARYGGGANAGHTVIVEDKKYVFHLIPSGILHQNTVCIIGNGCVVSLEQLMDELNTLREQGIDWHGRILISDRAQILFPFHQQMDMNQEAEKEIKAIGTTKRGIGPAYGDKISRTGLRMGDLKSFHTFAENLRQNVSQYNKNQKDTIDIEQLINSYRDISESISELIIDTSLFLEESMKQGKSILIEGAQGIMLDIDHGTYPFVTSSSTSIGGAITGLGIAPQKLTGVLGITKAYTTRVGAGPFPSELSGKLEEQIREQGQEYGATTGRPRRCGWFDAVVLHHAIRINGIQALNLTKLDVLSGIPSLKIVESYRLNGEEIFFPPSTLAELEQIEIVTRELPGWEEDLSNITKWEDLPQNAKRYVMELETILNVPISYIGIGPRRDQLIER